MQMVSLGKIAVATPGTLIPLSATALKVSKILVCQIAGMTGKTYFGTSALVRSTFVGVIKQFAIPVAGAGVLECQLFEDDQSGNGLNLADYYIDADVATEGLLVSYWVE